MVQSIDLQLMAMCIKINNICISIAIIIIAIGVSCYYVQCILCNVPTIHINFVGIHSIIIILKVLEKYVDLMPMMIMFSIHQS